MCQMDPLTTDTVSAQNSGETSHRHLVRGKHASLVVGAHTPGDAMLLHGDTTCTRGRQPVAPAPEPKLMRRCTRNNPTRAHTVPGGLSVTHSRSAVAVSVTWQALTRRDVP